MGCAVSKVGAEEINPIRRRIQEIKSRRIKDGPPLLKKDHSDEDTDSSDKGSIVGPVPTIGDERKEKEEEKETGTTEKEKETEREEEPQLGFANIPSSPSFKVYYRGSLDGNDFIGVTTTNQQENKGTNNNNGDRRMESNSTTIYYEGLYCKSMKKEKEKSLWTLTSIYSRLNIRSCYNSS